MRPITTVAYPGHVTVFRPPPDAVTSTSGMMLAYDEKGDAWDLEHAVLKPGRKNARAVVSVAFPGRDFDRVEMAAERAGKKLSAFIREAAVNRARRRPAP